MSSVLLIEQLLRDWLKGHELISSVWRVLYGVVSYGKERRDAFDAMALAGRS